MGPPASGSLFRFLRELLQWQLGVPTTVEHSHPRQCEIACPKTDLQSSGGVKSAPPLAEMPSLPAKKVGGH
eukprot:2880891-Alexandrium_andersonii.AAC.1